MGWNEETLFGRGRRFAPDLRRAISSVGRRLRGEGARWREIGDALGLCTGTVRRLCEEAPGFAPIEMPTYDAIFERLRAGPVIGFDQTSWPDLEDKSLPSWQMWCFTAPGLVYHRICDDKFFVRDPLVWLDNNRTERGLRGPVVGRRNHFGSKSARGTVVAATMYSLVESAKVTGIDPVAYLVEVATRAKRNVGAVLLPAAFKATA
jgi:hypothetical protein